MKIVELKQSREDYRRIQVERSRVKFSFCKVSIWSVLQWKNIISRSVKENVSGPILCLGTRNGREVDLFRSAFFSNVCHSLAVRLLERPKRGFFSMFPMTEVIGRSKIEEINEKSAVGVEINPDAQRRDIFIGSFDELPEDWQGKFNIIFSNSFDHSHDAYKTANEWRRVLSPGGYFILNYSPSVVEPSLTDPIANITMEDLMKLFPGELIYFNKFGRIYREIIIRKCG